MATRKCIDMLFVTTFSKDFLYDVLVVEVHAFQYELTLTVELLH